MYSFIEKIISKHSSFDNQIRLILNQIRNNLKGKPWPTFYLTARWFLHLKSIQIKKNNNNHKPNTTKNMTYHNLKIKLPQSGRKRNKITTSFVVVVVFPRKLNLIHPDNIIVL